MPIARSIPERAFRTSASAEQNLIWLKRFIWAYFFLLILEGALRKWILPSLSAPLLIVRDPIVFVIYFLAYRHRVAKSKLVVIAVISFAIVLLACTQLVMGTVTPVVAAFGVRSYLLHLPLIWIVAQTFDIEDVKQIGRWTLILFIPITLLMIAQYESAPSAAVNAGADQETGQIQYAGGHVRAAGPFSFVTGTQCLIPLVEAFLLFGITRRKTFPAFLLWPAAVAVILSIPICGSRTALFETGELVLLALIAALRNAAELRRLVRPLVVLSIAVVAVSQLALFNEAADTFQSRWQQGKNDEGGDVGGVLQLRVLSVITDGFQSAGEVPLLGLGVGLGSNVAAALTTGSRDFLLSEMEWARIVQEAGPIFGLGFMIFRVTICFELLGAGLRSLKRGSTLSWLLAACAIPLLIIERVEQPTSLGFMCLGAGLCLAAAREREMPTRRMVPALKRLAAPALQPRLRGLRHSNVTASLGRDAATGPA